MSNNSKRLSEIWRQDKRLKDEFSSNYKAAKYSSIIMYTIKHSRMKKESIWMEADVSQFLSILSKVFMVI